MAENRQAALLAVKNQCKDLLATVYPPDGRPIVMGWGDSKDWEPGLANGEVYVTIKSGDTGQPVSAALHDAGVTKTADVFYDYLIDEGIAVTFYPGVYRLQKKMTAEAALAALQDEKNKLENTVSVAEGGIRLVGRALSLRSLTDARLRDFAGLVR